MKLLFLLWILPVTLGDTSVTCIYSEACTLPCKSIYYDIIHWYKDKTAVHSFYHNADQLSNQFEEYKGRTSLLSASEIKTGNVSLMLKNIKIQDEGRYKCYTANDKSNSEQFVSVSVEAPVKTMDITLVNGTVTCTTNGVYPEPDVLWSSSPHVAKKPLSTFKKTEENLLTGTSILEVGAISNTYKYNCSITNKDSTKTYTAILEQELPVDEYSFECPVTKGFDYTLNFLTTTVLKYDSNTSSIHDQWKGKITVNPKTGTVKVSHLNEEQSGEYTWKCTTAQYRLIQKTTLLPDVKTGHVIAGILIPIIIIVVAVIVAVIIYKQKKMKESQKDAKGTTDTDETTTPLRSSSKAT